MRNIILIVHDIRSCHNVGSLLRTADGLGVNKVYFTGFTPYPVRANDDRLPHISAKLSKQINKTALGSENSVNWDYADNVLSTIYSLKKDGYKIYALEQSPESTKLDDLVPANNIVIIIGNEINGVDNDVLQVCDEIVEIQMFGKKESYNVTQAAAMALYHCRFA